jgi:hypothetical protein
MIGCQRRIEPGQDDALARHDAWPSLSRSPHEREAIEMRTNSGGCLTALVTSFSRIMLLMYWFSRPVAWNAAFPGGFLLPCLGFLFLPFTTMIYVWLVQGVGALQGTDWLWIILAVFCDLSSLASAAYANRTAIPGYPGSTTPPPSQP